MSTNPDSSSSAALPPPSPAALARGTDRGAAEPAAYAALRARVADELQAGRVEMARRWMSQSRSVTLRESEEGGGDAQVVTVVESVEAIIGSLATSLASDGSTSDEAIALGLAFGADAFARGASLHHTLKGLELLAAMTLYAVEASSAAGSEGGSAADGVRLARRLQQAASLITLSATRGYTQAVGESLRDLFRHLRHDLRNPLGTIKSALSMMDDESIPIEARQGPRFRAMATRNARTLDTMIVSRLSDAAAALPSLAYQQVSLRLVACAVRRDLRAEAEARGVTVLVGNSRARARVDAVGLELMLHEMLLAALHESAPGDELSLELGEPAAGRVAVRLSVVPPRAPVRDEGALRRARALAVRLGATLEGGSTLELSAAVQEPEGHDMPSATTAMGPPADSGPRSESLSETSGGGEPRDDLRGQREREHGQSGAL